MLITDQRISRKLVTALVIFLAAASTETSAEMVFKYRSSSVVEINDTADGSVSPDCYGESATGGVGDSQGCNNMLIVSDYMIRSVSSDNADPNGYYSPSYRNGGSERFFLNHKGKTYSFEDTSDNPEVGNIFTGNVTNMSYLFDDTYFNGDIGYWDVSNVTDMTAMFRDTRFQQDITDWDVSSAINIGGMFNSASYFNQDIGSWDVSSVEKMFRVFEDTMRFNQDIGSWDVSSANNMYAMFNRAQSFNQDLSGWCTPNISEKPGFFDTDTYDWTEPGPVWGDC